MERKERTIQDWLREYDQGKFNSKDTNTMCEAGWFDWFCKEESLNSRMNKMVPMIRAVAASPLLGTQPQYIFFKNNCPVSGHLYDSFSVCNMSDGKVQWWVCAKMGYDAAPHANICGPQRGFEFNLIEEYAKIKYKDLDDDKRSMAISLELNGCTRTIKRFFGPKDLQLKKQILTNTVPVV